jgi:hypothetical protein
VADWLSTMMQRVDLLCGNMLWLQGEMAAWLVVTTLILEYILVGCAAVVLD